MNDRLTKAAWIEHGLKTLAKHGVGNLKVGPMASALGVSRGSFYWHFADLGAFEDEVVEAWESTSTDQVIEVTAPASGLSALTRLIDAAMADDRALDRSVRAWALQEPRIANRLAVVDQRRIDHISALLITCGLEQAAAHQRAQFLYWSYLGRPTKRLSATNREKLVEEMVKMLLA